MADYIDRNAVKRKLKEDHLFEDWELIGLNRIIDAVPSADVEPIRWRKWLNVGKGVWVCSCCDAEVRTEGNDKRPAFKRCPSCESKMEED